MTSTYTSNNYGTNRPTSTVVRTEDRRVGQGLWSGIFAGLFIALLAFWTLFGLGAAVGGHSLIAISRDELDGLGLGAAIWTHVAAILSCFVGGYYCSRIVSYASWKAGIAEGLLVSSLFFLFLSVQSGMGLGVVGTGVTKTAGLATGAATMMMDRPEVRSIIGNGLNGLNFKSNPDQVVANLAPRLMRGDTEGAKNYLAYEAGVSPADVETRLNAMTASLNRTIEEIKEKAGAALAGLGWFIFATAFVGSTLCCLGAAMGARQNAVSSLTSNVRINPMETYSSSAV